MEETTSEPAQSPPTAKDQRHNNGWHRGYIYGLLTTMVACAFGKFLAGFEGIQVCKLAPPFDTEGKIHSLLLTWRIIGHRSVEKRQYEIPYGVYWGRAPWRKPQAMGGNLPPVWDMKCLINVQHRDLTKEIWKYRVDQRATPRALAAITAGHCGKFPSVSKWMLTTANTGTSTRTFWNGRVGWWEGKSCSIEGDVKPSEYSGHYQCISRPAYKILLLPLHRLMMHSIIHLCTVEGDQIRYNKRREWKSSENKAISLFCPSTTSPHCPLPRASYMLWRIDVCHNRIHTYSVNLTCFLLLKVSIWI